MIRGNITFEFTSVGEKDGIVIQSDLRIKANSREEMEATKIGVIKKLMEVLNFSYEEQMALAYSAEQDIWPVKDAYHRKSGTTKVTHGEQTEGKEHEEDS